MWSLLPFAEFGREVHLEVPSWPWTGIGFFSQQNGADPIWITAFLNVTLITIYYSDSPGGQGYWEARTRGLVRLKRIFQGQVERFMPYKIM